MNMFHLWYTKRYYLTHPRKLIKDIFSNLKWAWQRVYRGWDDRVVWDISQHIFEMMPEWLRALKESACGVPSIFFDENNTTVGLAEKRFHEIIDEMITGFESGAKLVSDDLQVYKDFEEYGIEKYGEKEFYSDNSIIVETDKNGGFPVYSQNMKSPYNKAWKEFDVIGKREQEIKNLKYDLDRALMLFSIYYNTLAD